MVNKALGMSYVGSGVTRGLSQGGKA